MKKIFRKAIASITLCGMLLSMSESSLVPFSSTYLAEDITADDGIVADDDALPVNSSVQEDKASGTRQDLTGAGLIEGEERDTQGGASSGSQAGEQNARTELQADVKDMDLHTEVSGAVPADAYLTAEQFTGTAAMEGLELLQAVKLEVMNADGTAYTQDADYEISITSSQIRDALSAGRTLSVYRAKRDGSSEQKREDLKVVEENGVKVLRFTNDKIDERPVFLIMEDALQQNTPESQTPQTEAVTQAQESETQAPQTETQVQESETQAPQTETQIQESETQAPQTETQIQESETQAPQTETQVQESETQAPAVAPQTLTAAPKTGESESETEAVSETESEPQSEAVSETETESELQSETESEAKLILTAQTLKGTIYSDETYTTLADSDKTIITVKGSLPENAVVLAYPVNVTLEGKTVLAAYDITIYTVDAEGNRTKYQPGEENPVEVTIESPAIQAANEEIQQSGNETQEVASDSSVVTGADDGQTITTGKEIGVYHIEDDKTGEPVEVKQSSEDTQPGEVKFGASSFSVYVVATEDILQQLSFTDKTIEAAIYTDDTYSTASQDPVSITISGNMPDGTVAKAYPADIDIDGQNVVAAYDIKMLIPVSDTLSLEYQPGDSNPVSVKIDSQAIQMARDAAAEDDTQAIKAALAKLGTDDAGDDAFSDGESKAQIDLNAIPESSTDAELSVYHMDSSSEQPEEVTVASQEESAVTFEAQAFSIYAVTEKLDTVSDADLKKLYDKLVQSDCDDYTVYFLQNETDPKYITLLDRSYSQRDNEKLSDTNVRYSWQTDGASQLGTNKQLNVQNGSTKAETYRNVSLQSIALSQPGSEAGDQYSTTVTCNYYDYYYRQKYNQGTDSITIHVIRLPEVFITDEIPDTGCFVITSDLLAPYESDTTHTYKYKWLRSDTENGDYTEVTDPSESGILSFTDGASSINVAIDQGAQKWYKFEIVRLNQDGSEEKVIASSDSRQVNYYNEIQNGGFENPHYSDSDWHQVANGTPQLIWKTTGVGTGAQEGRDIELWTNGYNGVSPYEGTQLVELNAETAGTLYQDVITAPGGVLNWGFSHRGRSGTDSMYMIAISTAAGQHIINQADIAKVAAGINSGSSSVTVSDGATISLSGAQLLTATDGNTAWKPYKGTYTIPEGQYLTRFLFGAKSTAGGNNTVGNFIDGISISDELPWTIEYYLDDANGTPQLQTAATENSAVNVKPYTKKTASNTSQFSGYTLYKVTVGDDDQETAYNSLYTGMVVMPGKNVLRLYYSPSAVSVTKIVKGLPMTKTSNGYSAGSYSVDVTLNGAGTSGGNVSKSITSFDKVDSDFQSSVTFKVAQGGDTTLTDGKTYAVQENDSSVPEGYKLTKASYTKDTGSSAGDITDSKKFNIQYSATSSNGYTIINEYSRFVTLMKDDKDDSAIHLAASFSLTKAGDTSSTVYKIADADKDKGIDITGLEDGTYTLTESEAPAGYEKADPITFKITGGVLTVTGGTDSVTWNSDTNTLTVHDKKFVPTQSSKPFIRVGKTITGLSDADVQKLIDNGFAVKVAGKTLSITDPTQRTFLWNVEVEDGTYTISEENAQLDDYFLTSTGLGSTADVSEEKNFITALIRENTNSTKEWKVTENDTTGFIFVCTETTQENPVISKEPLTLIQQKEIIKAAAELDANFKKTGNYKFYSLTDAVASTSSDGSNYGSACYGDDVVKIITSAGPIFYNTTTKMIVFSKTNVWQHVCGIQYDTQIRKDADFEVSNVYWQKEVSFQKADKDTGAKVTASGCTFTVRRKDPSSPVKEFTNVLPDDTLKLGPGTYEVIETKAPNGYLLPTDTVQSGFTFKIDSNGSITGTGTDYFNVAEETGSGAQKVSAAVTVKDKAVLTLTVKKKITGKMADLNDTFQFTVDVEDLELAEYLDQLNRKNTSNSITAVTEDGKTVYRVTFRLGQNGESSIILPYGTTYSIAETLADQNGYQTSVEVNDTASSEKVVQGTLTVNTTVTYTNNKPLIAPTELPMLRWRYIVMIAASVLGLAAVFVVFRRRRRFD